RLTEFRKIIVFPDGKKAFNLDVLCGHGHMCCDSGCCPFTLNQWMYFFYRLLLLSSPGLMVLSVMWACIMRNAPSRKLPLPSQDERLWAYRRDLDELLRKCYRAQ
ncbi:hypothetical protein PMAYCL1PPCAC_14064, partial [Pristionchus mayeri]